MVRNDLFASKIRTPHLNTHRIPPLNPWSNRAVHCGWTRSCCSVCDRATCMPSFVCRHLFFWGFCPLWTKDKQTRAPCQQLSKPPILPWLLLSCASGSVVTSLFTPHQGRTIIQRDLAVSSRRKALYPSVGAHGQRSRPSSGLYVEFK